MVHRVSPSAQPCAGLFDPAGIFPLNPEVPVTFLKGFLDLVEVVLYEVVMRRKREGLLSSFRAEEFAFDPC